MSGSPVPAWAYFFHLFLHHLHCLNNTNVRRHFMNRTFVYAVWSDVRRMIFQAFFFAARTYTKATLKNRPTSFKKHPSSQRRVRCTAHVRRGAKNCADTCVAIRRSATGSEGARQNLATTDSFNHLQRLLSLKSFRELVFVSDETLLLTERRRFSWTVLPFLMRRCSVYEGRVSRCSASSEVSEWGDPWSAYSYEILRGHRD